MSASSSTASSTLSRSRATVLVVASLATVLAGYYLYGTYAYQSEVSSLPGPGIHRSNAVHRRRRRATNQDPDTLLFVEDQIENDGEGHIVARTLTDGETVVDDQEYAWMNPPQAYQRSGQNIVQLLFRVSEDATRRNAYVHRGTLCNSCGVLPIRGIRYRCANCSDYDLCENCESQGVHSKAHIFYKIKVPAPAFGHRNIQPVWYTGDPSAVESQLPKHISTKLSRETGFERPELDAYWEQWTYMANTEWREDPDDIRLAMDRKTFERCLVPSGGYRQPAPNLIFDRMFAFYDTNKDDKIGFSEFLHGIAYRKRKDKWRKIFEGYDIDGDGYVDRKDFLRIFRSYYVLYRQMHRDMLEGMEDQQISTNEAHRLITSRQPLSSAFGQDGVYPRAPDARTGEGKIRRASGDDEVNDGKGVMSENGTDTGNREDVFRRDIPRRFERNGRPNPGYWATLLNPPESLNQIPAAFDDLEVRREVADLLHHVIAADSQHPDRVAVREAVNSDYALDGSDFRRVDVPEHLKDEEWPPADVVITDEDVKAIEGPGVAIEDVPPTARRAVIAHALEREKAQRQAYERWQRRRFYTDEEEGANPPANWKEEDDLLARAGLAGESSKTPPTRHSRSSSKVRFAEDMDDFDTRSNPSTSSRSVPERWGGMDIPDAEKDAGKEILFQITQQAFNELLDPLFKESEDMAMEIAATKAERDEFRAVWETHEFEAWALEREEMEEEKKKKNEENDSPKSPPNTVTNSAWPAIAEVEVEHVRELTLGELLAATGYRVEEEEEKDEQTHESTEDAVSTQDGPANTDNHSGQSSPLQPTPQDSEPSSHPQRDPTLPQFRPNSEPPAPASETPSPTQDKEWNELGESGVFRPASSSYSIPLRSPDVPARDDFIPLRKEEQEILRPSPIIAPSPEPGHEPKLPHDKDGLMKERAYHLWKCDKAEEEAEMRGGFGRLDFREFESRVKRLGREGMGNRMDYLGSWIEYCIP